MKNPRLRPLAWLGATLALLAVPPVSATDDETGDDNCPCALSAGRLDVPGNAIGSGAGSKVSVSGLTWEQTSTELEITNHQAKTELKLIAAVIPSVNASYQFTLAHQNQFKRDKIRRKIVVEYTDFTTDETAGRCYSYEEEKLCEDRTQRNCSASLSCKVTFKNGRGNQTFLDVGSFVTQQPLSSTTNLGAINLERRFPIPGGAPFPLDIDHDLECGDNAIEYITSFQWSLNTRTEKVSIYPDFGYSASCGECPETYGDKDQDQ